MHITMLGTGDALVSKIYNTCFVLDDDHSKLLVDAGGGNRILTQLDRAGIALTDIHDLFVTHAHTDHILGVIWVIRLFIQRHLAGKAEGALNVWSHKKVLDVLTYNINAMLAKKQRAQIGQCVIFHLLNNGDEFTIGADSATGYPGMHLKAFDILSTKEPQFGFTCLLPDGQKLVCLGDEPYNEANRALASDADWLMSEAFCKYADRDIYHPYEKSHSTALDAGRNAKSLGVRHLILYHSEEDTIATRKQAYAEEARQEFSGDIHVPDDLEVIEL